MRFQHHSTFVPLAKILVSILAALLVLIPTAVALAEGDVARGRALAERHCARCHVIGDFNRFGGIGSTPSFQLLVNSFRDYKARFETFYARRPHPAFVTIEGFGRHMEHLPPNANPVELPLESVADILAFAETLKAKGQ